MANTLDDDVRIDQPVASGPVDAAAEQTRKSLVELGQITQSSVLQALAWLIRRGYVAELP